MARVAYGNVPGLGQVLRVSKPPYDVVSEPFGSANISFDSRLPYLGAAVASGLIQCGGAPVYFDTLGYVPLVQIKRWDGSYLQGSDGVFRMPDPSGLIADGRTWIPAIGIVTSSSLSVVAYTNPFYSTTSYYNPNGIYYHYIVWAIG
jgi:hypothetical protein